MAQKLKYFSLIFWLGAGFLCSLAAQNAPGAPAQPVANAYDEELTFLLLPDSLRRDGRNTQAISLYRDFIDLYPNSRYLARVQKTMAEIYEEEQYYREALEVYRMLFRQAGITSKGLEFYYNQGRILNLMGEVEAADRIFRDIIETAPDSPYAKKSEIRLRLARLFEEA